MTYFIAFYVVMFLFFMSVGVHHVYTKLNGKLGFIETGIVMVLLALWPLVMVVFAYRRITGKDTDLFAMGEYELSKYLAAGFLINDKMNAVEFRTIVITADGKLRKCSFIDNRPLWNSRKGDTFLYAINGNAGVTYCKSIALVDNEVMNINQAMELDKVTVEEILKPIVPEKLMQMFMFGNGIKLIN